MAPMVNDGLPELTEILSVARMLVRSHVESLSAVAVEGTEIVQVKLLPAATVGALETLATGTVQAIGPLGRTTSDSTWPSFTLAIVRPAPGRLALMASRS